MKKILCGVDIGGTKLSVALVDLSGKIIDVSTDFDHTQKSEQGLTDQVSSNIKNLLLKNSLQESDLLGIGIGCAGHIRHKDGVIITTSNLKGFKQISGFR
jgi:glucokinase